MEIFLSYHNVSVTDALYVIVLLVQLSTASYPGRPLFGLSLGRLRQCLLRQRLLRRRLLLDQGLKGARYVATHPVVARGSEMQPVVPVQLLLGFCQGVVGDT